MKCKDCAYYSNVLFCCFNPSNEGIRCFDDTDACGKYTEKLELEQVQEVLKKETSEHHRLLAKEAGKYTIGDFVNLKMFNGEYIRMMVTSIDEFKTTGVDEEGWEHRDVNDNISGVPLTTEILEKNFPTYEEGYDIGWWPMEDGSFHIEFIGHNIEFVKKGVKYVHELQHIIRICELEKNIEL